MQGGDISNITPARFLFVFEGLVGMLDPIMEKKERIYRKLRRFEKAARCWSINETAVSYIWDISWRHHMQADLATYLPYGVYIGDRLEREGLPFSNVLQFETPEQLCQRLAYMPYVHRIYFSEPRRPFIYGDRGEFVDANTVFDPLS